MGAKFVSIASATRSKREFASSKLQSFFFLFLTLVMETHLQQLILHGAECANFSTFRLFQCRYLHKQRKRKVATRRSLFFAISLHKRSVHLSISERHAEFSLSIEILISTLKCKTFSALATLIKRLSHGLQRVVECEYDLHA